MESKENIFNFNNLFLLILVVLNLIVLERLNFFIPYATGVRGLMDFDAYYLQALDIRNQINPYTTGEMTTLGPPFVILPYVPFTLLKLSLARAIFNIISIFCGIISVYIISNRLFRGKKVHFLLLVFILFSSFPARFTIEMGQSNLILMLFVTILLLSKSKWLKILSLSLMWFFKSFFIYTAVSYYRYKSLIISTMIIFLILVLISLYFLKIEWILHRISVIIPKNTNTSVFLDLDYYNQNLFATLSRFNVPHVTFVSGILVTGASIYLLFSGNLMSIIILSMLFSPVAWQHYFVILFPIVIVVGKFIINSHNKLLILYLIAFLLWWIEFPVLHSMNKNILSGMLASHYFISAAILTIIIQMNHKYINF